MEEQIMIKYFNLHILLIIFLSLACGSKTEISLEEETAESLLEKGRAAYAKEEYDKTLQYIFFRATHYRNPHGAGQMHQLIITVCGSCRQNNLMRGLQLQRPQNNMAK